MICNFLFISNYRTNDEGYHQGVLSDEQHKDGKKRRLTNIQICFMGWVYESTGNVFTIITPELHTLGMHCLHYPDAIMMFVLFPLLHLMNDEDTKTVITDENYYQGLRHMLGLREVIVKQS